MPEQLSRRSLVAGSLAAGATLRAGSSSAAGVAATTGEPARLSATTYVEDPTLNFQTLFALGSAGYGISEVGEVLSAVDRINEAGPTYQRFFDVFQALGRRLAEQDEGAAHRGHRVSARERYLRSAEYYSQALYFVLGTNRPTRARVPACLSADAGKLGPGDRAVLAAV